MLRNFIKFAIRGVAGAIVDTSVLWILTTLFFHSYFTKYILSPAISYEVGIVATYIICYFWIWNNKVNKDKSDFFRRLIYYNFALIISLVIKVLVLAAINEIFNFYILISNLIALCFSGIFSFFASEKYIFIKREY